MNIYTAIIAEWKIRCSTSSFLIVDPSEHPKPHPHPKSVFWSQLQVKTVGD